MGLQGRRVKEKVSNMNRRRWEVCESTKSAPMSVN